jgi:hypothetical protein
MLAEKDLGILNLGFDRQTPSNHGSAKAERATRRKQASYLVDNLLLLHFQRWSSTSGKLRPRNSYPKTAQFIT